MIQKIYIIDDDEISAFLTCMLLETENLAVQTRPFLSAEAAFFELMKEKDANELPEIILLDLNMPLVSGWEFLDRLCCYEDELRGRTSVFILSSSIDPDEKKQSEKYCLIAGVLHKPLDEEGLEAISQVYNQNRKQN